MKTILVTGSAGFIGANLVRRLFKEMKEGTIVGLPAGPYVTDEGVKYIVDCIREAII